MISLKESGKTGGRVGIDYLRSVDYRKFAAKKIRENWKQIVLYKKLYSQEHRCC